MSQRILQAAVGSSTRTYGRGGRHSPLSPRFIDCWKVTAVSHDAFAHLLITPRQQCIAQHFIVIVISFLHLNTLFRPNPVRNNSELRVYSLVIDITTASRVNDPNF